MTPATHYLFDINYDSEELSKLLSEAFHTIMAKLLYIMQRARPVIETAVSFLMKRVSESDVEDWKKLKRVIVFKRELLMNYG